MNDEIKEILENIRKCCDITKEQVFTVYQRQDILKLLDYITNLQQDNTMYAQLKDEYEEEIKDLQQRIDKAIEYIEKDTRWFDSEYASIYGELCKCEGFNTDRLEVMVNPSNLLKILKGDSNE